MEDHRVVITGIAGRFPKADNVAEFQNNLLNKVDGPTSEHGRWDNEYQKVPQRLGACNNIEKFDRVFFGIHVKLCHIMDPMSRLLLEHSFEAVMDAGINPRQLKGANVAVYTSTNLSESEKTVFHHKVQHDGFGIMGSSKAMIANRISFFLGLTGPSLNIDCACSGSATALERAYYSIKRGHCDAALVCSSLLNLHPHLSFQLRALGILSPDGYTRPFDDKADGSTRSDGMVVLFLQRMTDARRIYQEVINVRNIHTTSRDCNSVLYPIMESQVDLMEKLLHESNLTPDDISFLEASGVGIRDIDAEELDAIDKVYGRRKKPLMIGSVRSNVGNPICVTSINSIIKMIIATETGQIPPNLHYETPNSKSAALKEGRLKVLTELAPWSGDYYSINTTSVAGVFSNIILKAPKIEKKNGGIPEDDLPRLVLASGRTEEAVKHIFDFMESNPVDVEHLQLLYDIFQSDIDAHLYRGFTIVPAKGLPSADSKKSEVLFTTGEQKEIWWVFSGMGSQWVGMGETLLRLPVFEAAIKKCDAVLKPHGFDIYKIITENDPKMFDNIVHSFVGIAAIQIGLVDVLYAVGLKPDFIIGHSVGELGCAYADGCFTAEQMVIAALSRGLASVETELIRGSMAAVGLGYEAVLPLCPPDIDVACHNGPESSTISGPAESMTKFVADLTAKGIFAREVPCSNIAYHSRYIAPAGAKLLEKLHKVIPKPLPRSSKWISSSVPRNEWGTMKARLSSAEYHTNNLLSAVLFDESSRQIPANAICIEIAPHGLLQAILKRSLPESVINIPLTRRGHPDNLEVLLAGLGKMYNAGLQPQVSALYPKVSYPVGSGTPFISPLVKWDHSADWHVNWYESVQEVKAGERIFEINLNEPQNQYLQKNTINGKVILPLSQCLINAWKVLQSFNDEENLDIVFEDINIHNMLVTVVDNMIKITVMVPQGSGKFEIIDSETMIASGTIKTTKAASQEKMDVTKKPYDGKYEISQDDFYTEIQMRGFHYADTFKNVAKASADGNHAFIKWKDDWSAFIDNAFQLYAFGNDSRQVEMPLIIRKIIIEHEKHAAAVQDPQGISAIVDKRLEYFSAGGLEIQGLKLATVPQQREQNIFSIDKLKVIPNIDRADVAFSTSLRLILQLIIENVFSKKIQMIEVIENNDPTLIKLFNRVMHEIPEASLFKIDVVPYENASFNKALSIITNDLNKYDLNDIAQKLGSDKFLLVYMATTEMDKNIKLAEQANLEAIFVRKSGYFAQVLLKKKQNFKDVHIINVSKNLKDTISKIKSKETSSNNSRVVILIKSTDNLNVAELVDNLEKSVNLNKIRIFDLQDTKVSDNPFTDSFYSKQLEVDLLINILTRQKVWATLRRTEITVNPKLCHNWVADKSHYHNPDSISWVESSSSDNASNLVRVEYSALNSQDLLVAHGNFYSDPSEMVGKSRLTKTTVGLEFAGLDSKENKVMGLTTGGSMSSCVSVDPDMLWQVPKSWSLEDAATVPLAYAVAYTALVMKADIEAGEKVLLSKASDGLGLAMLNLLIHNKCDVFITYDTEDEKKLIQSAYPKIPKNRLFKKWGSTFRDDVLLETSGVDVVICNQDEIKLLEVFFTMVKHGARVVLISDFNDTKVHESVGMEIFLREIGFYSVVPKRILSSNSENKKDLAKLLNDGIKSGCVKPLSRTVYKRDSINEAYESLQNKNLGKIVVKVQPEGSNKKEALALPRLSCSKNKSYIIIEALSNFGMELVDWLIVRGARSLVLASSSTVNNGYQNLRLNLWKNYGVKILLHTGVDLGNVQTIKALIKDATSMSPVDGIFDLGKMCRVAELKSSNEKSELVTKILNEESKVMCPNLRLFVVCSAVTNTGTSKLMQKFNPNDYMKDPVNKGAIDVVEKRRMNGLHGLIINLGVIEPIRHCENVVQEKIVLPPVTKYLDKLDEVLFTDESIIDVYYVAPSTKEVEIDAEDVKNVTMDSEQREAEEFLLSLYEQHGIHVEGFSHLEL